VTLRRLYRLVRHQPLGAAAGLLLLVMALVALLAPAVSPYDPLVQDGRAQLAPPSAAHLFGTDYLGRDVLSRVIWGARVSLGISFAAVALGTVLGVAVGLFSGYVGGWWDLAIQRMMDIVMAVPGIVLALALVAILGTSAWNVILVIAVVMVPGMSRVVRSAVLQVRQLLYVEAAQALGLPDRRIALRHVLPNVVAPILVMATTTLGNAVLIEASLSFLGAGPPPPAPTWGGMLSGEARTWFERAHWMAIYPGLALTLTVIAFNAFGDMLRDTLDPKMRGRG